MGADGTANLKPCKKGETHNPNGRPKGIGKMIDGLSPAAKVKVYGILHEAIRLKNVKEASQYIMSQDGVKEEYGIVLQLAAKGLTGKNGWAVLNDILDRLFGKAKQVSDIDITTGGEPLAINVSVVRSREQADEILKAREAQEAL